MGTWGIKERQSDDGSDRFVDYLYYAKENGNIIDIDYTLKSYMKFKKNSYKESFENNKSWIMTVNCIVIGELIYYFKTNTYMNEIFHYDDYGYLNINKIHGTRKGLENINKVIKMYRKSALNTFKESGWFKIEDYKQRCNWIDKIISTLDNILTQSVGDSIIIFDKEKEKPAVYMYDVRIKMTNDHDLNRLRIYLKDWVNVHIEYMNKGKSNINYYEADTYIDKSGVKYYKLIYHDFDGKQKTILKDVNIDRLVYHAHEMNAVEDRDSTSGKYQKFHGFTDYKRWQMLYNKDNYMRFIKRI